MSDDFTQFIEALEEQGDSIPIDEVVPAQGQPNLDRTFTLYSKAIHVTKKDGIVYGRWVGSFSEACGFTPYTNSIDGGGIISIGNAGKCAKSKEKIIKVVTN
ncbi:hypothetical protein [uncultured Tateyamaria sp.]|uniref:hypothetical protein n=1 Tax=uncultured Tateyamaria sp. TaxID=455651 RepID=UPI002634D1D9|nr:hypothetical protein [uncultured Tateyamaria sp.]